MRVPTVNSKRPSKLEMGGRAQARASAHFTISQSIQREPGRIAAHVGRRVQRLTIDRAIQVLAGE